MAGAGDIRAGRAFVEAYLDKTKLDRGLKQLSGQLKAFGAGISSLGTKFMMLGAGVVTPLLLATKHFMNIGDQLDKMAARTGMSTNALSELGFAAEQSGADIEQLEKAVRKMQKTIMDAASGEKTYVDALKMVGLSYQALAGLSPEDQFTKIAEGVNAISDPTKKAAAAIEIFGRSGTMLLPMLGDMKALREEAKRLGLSIGPEQAKQAAALEDAWNRVKRSFGAVAVAIGSELAPGLTRLANRFKDLLGPMIEWLGKHGALVQSTLRLGVALTALGVTLKVLGFSITLLAAHPLVAAFIALGLAVTALSGGFRGLFDETKRWDDAAGRALDRGDRQRVAMRGLASELQELASEQQLGANQQERAKELIAELTKAYGDLGLSVDETTGKIVGFDAAQTKLNATMAEAAKNQLAAQLAALNEQIKAAEQAMERERSPGPWPGPTQGPPEFIGPTTRRAAEELAHGLRFILGFQTAELERLSERLMDMSGRRAQIVARLNQLLRGNLGAMVPAAAPGAPGTGAAAGFDAKLRERLDREANQRHLETIADEERRAIAATRQKWNAELAAATRTSEEKRAIAREEAEEIAFIQKEYADKREKELTANRRRVNDEIERALIDNAAEGSAKRLALLELERKQALRDAEGMGIHEEINRLFDIKKQGIDLEAARGPRVSVAGTFSASAVAGLTQGVQERTARAVERHLPRIARGIDRLGLEAAP